MRGGRGEGEGAAWRAAAVCSHASRRPPADSLEGYLQIITQPLKQIVGPVATFCSGACLSTLIVVPSSTIAPECAT